MENAAILGITGFLLELLLACIFLSSNQCLLSQMKACLFVCVRVK